MYLVNRIFTCSLIVCAITLYVSSNVHAVNDFQGDQQREESVPRAFPLPSPRKLLEFAQLGGCYGLPVNVPCLLPPPPSPPPIPLPPVPDTANRDALLQALYGKRQVSPYARPAKFNVQGMDALRTALAPPFPASAQPGAAPQVDTWESREPQDKRVRDSGPLVVLALSLVIMVAGGALGVLYYFPPEWIDNVIETIQGQAKEHEIPKTSKKSKSKKRAQEKSKTVVQEEQYEYEGISP